MAPGMYQPYAAARESENYKLRTLRNTLGIHTEGETLYGRDTSKPKARGGISPAVGSRGTCPILQPF